MCIPAQIGRESDAAKYIRMDNLGENKKLMERVIGANLKVNLKCEFTTQSTTQQNGLVEVQFAL